MITAKFCTLWHSPSEGKISIYHLDFNIMPATLYHDATELERNITDNMSPLSPSTVPKKRGEQEN